MTRNHVSKVLLGIILNLSVTNLFLFLIIDFEIEESYLQTNQPYFVQLKCGMYNFNDLWTSD